MHTLSLKAQNVAAMEALGQRLARALGGQGVVYLEGDLGTGKTTLSRGILRAYGHQGAVKSPTYTLVEPYELAAATIFHFDLYRLLDPEELELMGFRDYFRADALTLVEWPARGGRLLPAADIIITLTALAAGRALELRAGSVRGEAIVAALTTAE
jgi:tRNA threonylcarbamoyladenosine biosynthesis protein TsaE